MTHFISNLPYGLYYFSHFEVRKGDLPEPQLKDDSIVAAEKAFNSIFLFSFLRSSKNNFV